MPELIFATNNLHKLGEVNDLFRIHNLPCDLVSLQAIGITEDIPEEEETLNGNARAKALYVFRRTGQNCFADDTGLEVDALNGEPGVYSARYAGEGCSFHDNVLKLLGEMNGETDRAARFRTVIHLFLEGKEYSFEGQVEGRILEAERGKDGFGYDPVFQPEGYDCSFAEMSLELKNSISHRARAFMKMAAFLADSSQP